jgi:hypothetical protein
LELAELLLGRVGAETVGVKVPFVGPIGKPELDIVVLEGAEANFHCRWIESAFV